VIACADWPKGKFSLAFGYPRILSEYYPPVQTRHVTERIE